MVQVESDQAQIFRDRVIASELENVPQALLSLLDNAENIAHKLV